MRTKPGIPAALLALIMLLIAAPAPGAAPEPAPTGADEPTLTELRTWPVVQAKLLDPVTVDITVANPDPAGEVAAAKLAINLAVGAVISYAYFRGDEIFIYDLEPGGGYTRREVPENVRRTCVTCHGPVKETI